MNGMDPKFAVINALMDARENLQRVQHLLAEVTEQCLDDWVTEARDDADAHVRRHACEPQPNASLHDEPPSRPAA